jgi:hypothetical protein
MSFLFPVRIKENIKLNFIFFFFPLFQFLLTSKCLRVNVNDVEKRIRIVKKEDEEFLRQ